MTADHKLATTRAVLATLKRQFEAGASRYPRLNHLLVEAPDDQRKWLLGPFPVEGCRYPKQAIAFSSSPSEIQLRVQTTEPNESRIAKLLGPKLFQTHMLYISGSNLTHEITVDYLAGRDHFVRLAERAGECLLSLPSSIINTHPHEWTDYERHLRPHSIKKIERLTKQENPQIQTVQRIYDAILPSGSTWSDRWCVFLHWMAWRGGEGSILKASRNTWSGTVILPWLPTRTAYESFTSMAPPLAQFPFDNTRHFFSIIDNIFFCTAIGIDILESKISQHLTKSDNTADVSETPEPTVQEQPNTKIFLLTDPRGMDTAPTTKCPLCKREAAIDPNRRGDAETFNCPRCGKFTIGGSLLSVLSHDQESHFLLSGVTRNATERGEELPVLTMSYKQVIEQIPHKTLEQKLNRLLEAIRKRTEFHGHSTSINPDIDYPLAYCCNEAELTFCLKTLADTGSIKYEHKTSTCILTQEGWSKFEIGDAAKTDFSQIATNSASIRNTDAVQDAKTPLKIMFCYSHRNKIQRRQVETHLALLKRQGLIEIWYDRKITAGTEWNGLIDNHLNTSDITLLLISADFLESDYCCDVEMKRAIERHKSGEARVIPVILRKCQWKDTLLKDLQALPSDGLPVDQWTRSNDAYDNIASGIRNVIAELKTRS